MTFGYLLIAAILFSCILADRFSGKFGMPALILFMAVGMIFGCDGLFKIQFDNYAVAEKVCAAALVFIMFYGGFNTKWQSAKCVAVRATILSTLGVLVTAGLTGVFCYFVLPFFLCRELFDRRRSFLYGCGKRVFYFKGQTSELKRWNGFLIRD